MPANKQSILPRAELMVYGIAAMLAVLTPLLMVQLVQQWHLPFIHLMDEIYHPIVLLQLFVFTASAALCALLVWKVWGKSGVGLRAELPLLLGILVSFHFLALLRHHAARSWDYACYERAAQAIVAGQNPYGDCYIYFPTPAQTLAGLERLSAWGVATLGLTYLNTQQALWDLVFYFYEATQFLLITLAFFLCYRLATTLGIERIKAAVLVAVLFLINNPLLATLTHNQVNLWVLNLLLAAILWLPQRPVLSGLLVALGGHIKLYPLALLLPWVLQRRWRAVVSSGVGLLGIVLIQTGGGRHLALWNQFLAFANNFPRGTFFRDNSLHSLVYNSLGHLKWLLRDGSYEVNERYVSMIVLAGIAILGLLYLIRYIQRENGQPTASSNTAWKSPLLAAPTQATPAMPPRDRAQLGHALDAIAVALVASPVVWEHHYLLAMPLLIGAVAWAKSERHLWMIGIGAVSIFALPTFDLFPFSYHRLVGLLLLTITLAPAVEVRVHDLLVGARALLLPTNHRSGYRISDAAALGHANPSLTVTPPSLPGVESKSAYEQA